MKRSVTWPPLVVAGAAVAPVAPLPAVGADEQASVFTRPPPRTTPPASFRNDFRVRPGPATCTALLAQTTSHAAESIKQRSSLAVARHRLPIPPARSVGRAAAGDIEHRAGAERAFLRGQPGDQRGHLLWSTGAAHRDPGRHVTNSLVAQLA